MTDPRDDFAAEFLSESPFSTEAIYTQQGFAAKSVIVDFQASFLAAQGLGEVGVASSAPAATAATADLPDAGRGDTLSVDDVLYYVQEARPDGNGFTILILSKDPVE